MTDISEIKPGDQKTEIIGTITKKGDERSFEKFGNTGKVCSCTLEDETGNIGLTLWNEEIELVNEGDRIKVTNGYISEFREEIQVSKGKFGSIEVLETAASDKLKEPEGEYIEDDFDTPEEKVE